LYEPDAVITLSARQIATGHDEIRKAYMDLLAARPPCTSAGQRPAIRNGDLALTSTHLPDGGTTVEMARRQLACGPSTLVAGHPDEPVVRGL
jgi:hypothetical protein